jgi:tRNA (mo5U34)-methyltransferase
MTEQEIMDRVAELHRFCPWYHIMDLAPRGGGVFTPGWKALEPTWTNIRGVRSRLTYSGRRVLDLGSRDGMWAFEAEALGAGPVVATDIGWTGYLDHMVFCREVLGSKVVPFYNIPVERLTDGLACFWRENPGKFDIVQHLGLLYHLEDMMVSLRQARACLKDTGRMLLETAIYTAESFPMARFNSDQGVYSDTETFWAPNMPCLDGMLRTAGFEIDTEGVNMLGKDKTIDRVALWAKAI